MSKFLSVLTVLLLIACTAVVPHYIPDKSQGGPAGRGDPGGPIR